MLARKFKTLKETNMGVACAVSDPQQMPLKTGRLDYQLLFRKEVRARRTYLKDWQKLTLRMGLRPSFFKYS